MKEKRTYADRAEYLIRAVSNRRRKIKKMAIEYKGGKCFFCGYLKCVGALDFHHLSEKKKSFRISEKGHSRSWNRVKCELDHCILVCANCHRELHAGLLQPPIEISE